MATTALSIENQWDFSGLAFLMKDLVVTGSVFIGGNGMSATELGFLDGVVAGTAAASKALVLNSSSGITTITSATITTLTSTTVNATTGNIGAIVAPTNLTLNGTSTGTISIGNVSTGAVTITPATTVTGVITPTGGVAAAGGGSVTGRTFHTGGAAPQASTEGTNLDIVTTETYRCEVFVPANFSSTGIAIFNGTAVAGNVQAFLLDSTGTQVGSFATASTAASGTTAYQRIPWSGGPYSLKGPATYWLAVQGNNSGGDLRTHVFGNFGADKQTGTTYGTVTVATAPSTFTTGLGIMASLY